MSPLSPRDTDRQTERHADTLGKHRCSHRCHSHRRVFSPLMGKLGRRHTPTLSASSRRLVAIPMLGDVRCWKQKDLHKFVEDFQQLRPTEGARQQVEPVKRRLSAWFLIRGGQKSVAVTVNKRPVIAALLYRPDFTFTPSLWGRPNDFYLPLRKHIKAISDCGSPLCVWP